MDTITPLNHDPYCLQGTNEDEQSEPTLDPAYLDAFLKALPNDCSPISLGNFICEMGFLKGEHFNSKQFLKGKKLITEEQNNYTSAMLRLTPEGKLFLGFEKRKERSLNVNGLINAALILCGIAIILCIVAIVILI